VFNTRRQGNDVLFDGDQIAIDGSEVWYESLCAACYLDLSGGKLG
jgi:thymidine kinase